MMTQCSVLEIILLADEFLMFQILWFFYKYIMRMSGCVMLALEEWVVLYIIDTRRSLDLGLLFSIYHPGFFTYPWAFHGDGHFMAGILGKHFVNALALLLGIFLGGRVCFPRTQIMMLPSKSDFSPCLSFYELFSFKREH